MAIEVTFSGNNFTVSVTAGETGVLWDDVHNPANWVGAPAQATIDSYITKVSSSAPHYKVKASRKLRISCDMDWTGRRITFEDNANWCIVAGGIVHGGALVDGQPYRVPVCYFERQTGWTTHPSSSSESQSSVTAGGRYDMVGLSVFTNHNTQANANFNLWASSGQQIIQFLELDHQSSAYNTFENNTASTGSVIGIKSLRRCVIRQRSENIVLQFVNELGWMGGDNTSGDAVGSAPKLLTPSTNALYEGFSPKFVVADANSEGGYLEITNLNFQGSSRRFRNQTAEKERYRNYPSNDSAACEIERNFTVSPISPTGAPLTDYSYRIQANRVVTTHNGTADGTPSGATILASGDDEAGTSSLDTVRVWRGYGQNTLIGGAYKPPRVEINDIDIAIKIRTYDRTEAIGAEHTEIGAASFTGSLASIDVNGVPKASAAALTGFTLDFAAKTMAISSANSVENMFAHYRYLVSRVSNFDYPEAWSFVGSIDCVDWDITHNFELTGDLTTTGALTLGSVSEGVTIKDASNITIDTLPTALTLDNTTLTVDTSLNTTIDLSGYTLLNGATIDVIGSTGTLTIIDGGNTGWTITDSTTTGTLVRDSDVNLTISLAPTGGTLAWQDLSKFDNFLGVYVSHVAAQADNPTPSAANYYSIDSDSNGIREDHGYYDGSAWVETGSATIHNLVELSIHLGGSGAAATEIARVPNNSTIEYWYDCRGYTKQLGTVTTVNSAVSKEISLAANPSTVNISEGTYTTASGLVASSELLPADSDSVMTGKIPHISGSNVDLCLAFVEIMMLTEEAAAGGLAQKSAIATEIIDSVVVVSEPTFRVMPLDGTAIGDETLFGAKVDISAALIIDPTFVFNPINGNTRVCYNQVGYSIVNGATVTGTVDADITKVKGADVSGIADFKAGTEGLALEATVKALNNFDPANDTVANVTAVSDPVTLANNSITSSVVANNALNNSSFTTGYFNSINAEVDTALADYGANTVAPDNASIAAILVDTDELQTNQGDWLTADISVLPTTNEDARFTFRGGRLEAVHPLAKIEEITVDTSVVTDFEDNFIELETVTEDAISKTGAITSMTTTAASLTVDSTGADNLWVMGDGTHRTEQDYTHTFADDGKAEHTVSLVAGTQTYLNCSVQGLSAIDVSDNPLLTDFHCYTNNLTVLEVSKNKAITRLFCQENNLPTSEVSQILIDLAANNISNAVIRLEAQNPAAPPAGAAMQSLIDLENAGCTITVDNYLGAQLLTNSDFDTGLSGWNVDGDTTWDGGALKFTSSTGNYSSFARQVFSVTESGWYVLELKVTTANSVNDALRILAINNAFVRPYPLDVSSLNGAGTYKYLLHYNKDIGDGLGFEVYFEAASSTVIGDTITIDYCRLYPVTG